MKADLRKRNSEKMGVSFVHGLDGNSKIDGESDDEETSTAASASKGYEWVPDLTEKQQHLFVSVLIATAEFSLSPPTSYSHGNQRTVRGY